MVEPHEAGYRFVRTRAAWPLHITLVPWFVITDAKIGELMTLLDSCAQSFHSFQTTVGPDAALGANQDIPVNLMADVGSFRAVQDKLLVAVRSTFMSFVAPKVYIEDEFKPHITHHSIDGHVHKVPEGTTLSVDGFSLVRLGPAGEGQMCEVVRNFTYGVV